MLKAETGMSYRRMAKLSGVSWKAFQRWLKSGSVSEEAGKILATSLGYSVATAPLRVYLQRDPEGYRVRHVWPKDTDIGRSENDSAELRNLEARLLAGVFRR